jgi:hypothetical protein
LLHARPSSLTDRTCAAIVATSGGSSIQEFTAANPYYPPTRKPLGVRIDVWIHVARQPSVRRPRRPILPNQSRETARAQSKTGEPRKRAAPRHVASTQCPSALSLRLSPRHHPRASTTAHCLAGQSPESSTSFRQCLSRLLLRPLSQTSGFEALRRPGAAPETMPAPEVLPALVMLFV